jgi:hypothetical protein
VGILAHGQNRAITDCFFDGVQCGFYNFCRDFYRRELLSSELDQLANEHTIATEVTESTE